jgi:hypothetical protein
VVIFTPRPVYPVEKSPQCPLDRRLGGRHNQSGRRGKEKILPLPGLELRSLGHEAHSQSFYRLRYPGSYYYYYYYYVCSIEQFFSELSKFIACIFSEFGISKCPVRSKMEKWMNGSVTCGNRSYI